MPVHPKRSSNHLLPANAEAGPSIDEVSDSDQFIHAATSSKRYYSGPEGRTGRACCMSDDDTDTSDMPGIREYSHPRRGMFPGSSYMRVVPGVGSVRSATTDGRKGSNE